MKDNPSIDEQLKVAQLAALAEETAKLKSEREKTEVETLRLKYKYDISWWKRYGFWKIFGAIFTGVVILGFHITYVLSPLFQAESIRKELSALKKERKYTNLIENLKQDSLRLEREKNKVSLALDLTVDKMERIDCQNFQLDERIQVYKQSLLTKESEISRLVNEVSSLQRALKEINDKQPNSWPQPTEFKEKLGLAKNKLSWCINEIRRKIDYTDFRYIALRTANEMESVFTKLKELEEENPY